MSVSLTRLEANICNELTVFCCGLGLVFWLVVRPQKNKLLRDIAAHRIKKKIKKVYFLCIYTAHTWSTASSLGHLGVFSLRSRITDPFLEWEGFKIVREPVSGVCARVLCSLMTRSKTQESERLEQVWGWRGVQGPLWRPAPSGIPSSKWRVI